MVDKNSEQYLKSAVNFGYYQRSDNSIAYEKKINVSGNIKQEVYLLTNRL
jgi:hypothetical protein